MASPAIPREEMAGLALAVVLHAGLVALLVLQPASAPVVPPPERISVTLSETATDIDLARAAGAGRAARRAPDCAATRA